MYALVVLFMFAMAPIRYDLGVNLELQVLIEATSQLEKDLKC